MSALAEEEIIDGKYRIVRFLGKGAWASVYEGVNIRLHRRVAIKVLGKETLQHPGVVERFEREGQAATQIESDHVIDIFDIGSLEDGRPYMVMELLDGEDLAKTFEKDGILEPERAVFYVVQALTGLGAAHAAGVLHRDIKPANVVLVKKQDQELVKIVDFGISKLHSGAVPQASAMTQTNAVLGSPVYMSPEQCRGARLMDHRSDLYSLGVVLYEALTGKVPHIADTFNALMFKIALEDVPDPRTHRPDLDAGLAAIILKALARDQEKRYQSAADFRAALVEWADAHGLDPANWVGSVRNLVAATKSSSSRKVAASHVGGEDATSTPVLTDSGKRKAEGSAATLLAPALSDSQSRAKDPAPAADPAPSRSRPAEPSAERAAPNRRPIYAGLAAVAVVAISAAIALGALRKSDPPTIPDSKTGLVATSTATASPSATPTATATATDTASPAATASAMPTDTASASPTAAATTAAAHVGTRPIGIGTPRASTTTSASATASAKVAPSAPAASASAKTTVDGRTIHTTF